MSIFPIIQRTKLGRTGNIIAAHHGPCFVDLAGKRGTLPAEIITARHFRPRLVDDTVTRPHHLVTSQPGNDIMAPFFFPSINIFGRHVGGHVHVTAGAASAAGNVPILFHCSMPFRASGALLLFRKDRRRHAGETLFEAFEIARASQAFIIVFLGAGDLGHLPFRAAFAQQG